MVACGLLPDNKEQGNCLIFSRGIPESEKCDKCVMDDHFEVMDKGSWNMIRIRRMRRIIRRVPIEKFGD